MKDINKEFKTLIRKLTKFRDERNWKQFHNGKDLALALSIEAAELNEVFLWKSVEQADVGKIKEELADVLIYGFLIANEYNLDISSIITSKIKMNDLKYPVAKSRNSANKYTEI